MSKVIDRIEQMVLPSNPLGWCPTDAEFYAFYRTMNSELEPSDIDKVLEYLDTTIRTDTSWNSEDRCQVSTLVLDRLHTLFPVAFDAAVVAFNDHLVRNEKLRNILLEVLSQSDTEPD